MIEQLINKQDGFEQVRDRLAEILTTESLNQQQLALDQGLDPANWTLAVYEERSNPVELFRDATTLQNPVVNVWFDSASFPKAPSQLQSDQTSIGQFNIDCYGHGVSQDTARGHDPGDCQAAKEGQRAAKLCRNILMAGQYYRLGFAPNELVSYRNVLSLNSFQTQFNNQAGVPVAASRIVLEVRYNETSQNAAGEILELISTKVTRQSDGLLLAEADYPK